MLQLLKSSYIEIKSEIEDNIEVLKGRPRKGHGTFSKRIKRRHRAFWKAPDAEIVRNTMMDASDPIVKWKNVQYWQRKLSNKHNAREFAKMHGCQVPDLYWRGKNVATLDFTRLPEHFVIRPTIGHTSQNVFVMKNGVNLLKDVAYPHHQIRQEMELALQNDENLEFLVEEFVRTEQGEYQIPVNYMLHSFNGQVAGMNVLNRRGPTTGFMRAYDEHWNLMDDIACDFPRGPYQDPPKCLPEIVAQAKILSKAYEIYVRVDFFATDKGPVFNEFSPTPTVGDYFTRAADKLFVSYWDRYCPGKI